ncbi:hypothetical protein DFH06DRAFT_1483481 [Mycena polygramma]|nr:hypothetical protein DFH06DRAFT_1483481 [Mycena polygramma]
MHRALRIPEVLQIIYAQICPDRNCKLDKDVSRDLASLAKTCTTLSVPALDALWCFQESILNVLDCMPDGLWTKDRTLLRPILRADWDRPLLYMYRVRILSCYAGSRPWTPNISLVFEMLHTSLPTTQLFPDLRRLRWVFDGADSPLSHIPILLAPGITNITLGSVFSISHLTLLPTIAIKCPSLTHVEFFHAPYHPETGQSQAVASFICGSKRLQSLEVYHLDQPAFDHLAHLPDLRTVTLWMPRFTQPDFLSGRNIEKPAYTALRELKLQTAPSQSVLAFIASLCHSPLESLDIEITPPPDATSLKQIHVALKRYLPSASLTKLCITSDPIYPPEIAPPALTMEVILHLFHFTNLTFVYLRPPSGIFFDDDAVLSMAEAWPRLRHLSLLASRPPRGATLRSLLFLAQRCPELEWLAMPVNALDVPKIDTALSGARVLQHALTAWLVADSLIDATSPLPVARFLSGLFPKLTRIDSSVEEWLEDEDFDEEMAYYWDEVAGHLQVCHEMRGEERFWAKQVICDRPHREGSVEV